MADRGSSKVLIALLVVHTTLLPRVVGLQPAGSTVPGLGLCVRNFGCNSANNGGVCSMNDYCVCNTGYSGTNCQTNSTNTVSGLGYCDSADSACNIANKGGFCTDGHCACNSGFTGLHCETSSAGTASGMGYCYDGDAACNSANGGGTCVLPSGFTPAHYCLCNAGFGGYQCETDISGTVSGLGACTGGVACNSANGGGSCATFPVNYCVCTAGFTGNQCQTSPQASPSTSPSPRGPSGSPSPSISPSPTSPSIIPYTSGENIDALIFGPLALLALIPCCCCCLLAAGWRFWRDDRQERDERDLVYETPAPHLLPAPHHPPSPAAAPAWYIV